MSVPKPRLAVAGVFAAAAIALPTAALASSPGAAPAKPAPSAAASQSPTASKSPAASNPSAAASKSAAAQSAQAGGGSEAAMVAAFASQLGISQSAATQALDQIEAVGRGGVDPGTPAFTALARHLGVTPALLTAALRAAKLSLAGE